MTKSQKNVLTKAYRQIFDAYIHLKAAETLCQELEWDDDATLPEELADIIRDIDKYILPCNRLLAS